jgi:SAM-dependent methyltransferase
MKSLLRRWLPGSARSRPPMPGRFQPYSHTLPNRYPWLFEFAAEQLSGAQPRRLLSFGCSRGDEVFTLRSYFPDAELKGIDISLENIDACRRRLKRENAQRTSFVAAANSRAEPAQHYDAVFCLAVLCHGDLSTLGAARSDALMRFEDFADSVADLARCLKPGGLLMLHTTNFRFCDTETFRNFTPVLRIEPEKLAPDVLFDRHNQLMPGVQYLDVAFRKRG